MSKIRINELARQLEVKSREVIDKLHELGITEPLTHSSSIDDDNAEKLKRYFGGDTSVIVAQPRREPDAQPRREPDAQPRREPEAPARQVAEPAPKAESRPPAAPAHPPAQQPPAATSVSAPAAPPAVWTAGPPTA